MTPTVLLILDGWGAGCDGPGNAVCLAETPNLDRLLAEYPHTELACSGRAVGLPEGFMGNSEVGHMNIGAGRVVYQDMTRIDMAVEDGSFFDNPTLTAAMDAAKATGGALHLLGLVSDGGVHSHQRHIEALIAMAKARGLSRVYVHAFLDGRDTPPTSGSGYVDALAGFMRAEGVGRVATLMGRYWAMDRDQRWERNEKAWNALVHGQGEDASALVDNPGRAVRDAYAAGETDEFVTPRVLDSKGVISDGDAVMFFNFRADRARQLVRAFFEDDFNFFERGRRPKLAALASMTRYDADFPVPPAFPPQSVEETLGQTVAEAGLTQLRIAETEKYAHVTYFLNCGREEPWPGEEHVLIPSPRDVPTYDLKPAMSAWAVTDTLLAKLPDFDLVVCNLANLDMVGHTGVLEAAIQAAEVVDACVGRIAEAVLRANGRLVITADHGNAEEMRDESGNAITAHSMNPVPLVYVEAGAEGVALRRGGKLADIAPTLLARMGLSQPGVMSGVNLVKDGGGD